MSEFAFKFESRACPSCGEEFDALVFWSDDQTCSACGRAAYEARLAKMNEGRAYTIESMGGMCPTQAQGRFADGRPYYFRARHGTWTLQVGRQDDPVDFGAWAFDGEYLATGDDSTHGGMDDAEVLAILDAASTEAKP